MNPRGMFWILYAVTAGAFLAFIAGAPWPALAIGLGAGLLFALLILAAFEP